MSNELFKNRFLIPSARADFHDYNGGLYFITICTQNREHFFGEITNSIMQLSEIGQYTNKCIPKITEHNPYARIPLWVVMPNHVHLLVAVEAGDENQWRQSIPGKNEDMQKLSNHQGRLSTAIGGFKQSVTRYAKEHHIPFSWQSRFHDHIVRTTAEMNKISDYIQHNPSRWQTDTFNQPAPS